MFKTKLLVIHVSHQERQRVTWILTSLTGDCTAPCHCLEWQFSHDLVVENIRDITSNQMNKIYNTGLEVFWIFYYKYFTNCTFKHLY